MIRILLSIIAFLSATILALNVPTDADDSLGHIFQVKGQKNILTEGGAGTKTVVEMRITGDLNDKSAESAVNDKSAESVVNDKSAKPRDQTPPPMVDFI
ncbi:hypothetical protein CROQUDRAFT_668165 [Cronartium quercuum f. sp. fusiforme G11]|uniref:Secreted protein n=1 Tax=Cronartium quercuum f. sp. fusiforme G11 TaxID=708437 RepID=A0A9P6NT06_9BASI|nr:hypothetical protein CROQUDRAFT_668165 [Cronartium quercuum f. sp. fusiforme G11]